MLAAVKLYAWAGIEAVADVAAEVKSQTVDAAVIIASAARAASATPSPSTPPRKMPTALEADATTANAGSPSVKDVVRSFEAKAASSKDKPSSPLKKSARPVMKKQGSFIQRMAQRISPSKGKEQEKPQEPPPQQQQIVITSLSPPAPIMKKATLTSPRATVNGAGASTNGESNPAAPEPVLVTPPPSSSSSSSAEKEQQERGSGSGRAKKTLSGRLLFPLRSPSSRKLSSDSILSSSSSGSPIPAAIDREGSLSNDGSESPTAASSASGSVNGSAEKGEGGSALSRQGSLGKPKTILKNSDWR